MLSSIILACDPRSGRAMEGSSVRYHRKPARHTGRVRPPAVGSAGGAPGGAGHRAAPKKDTSTASPTAPYSKTSCGSEHSLKARWLPAVASFSARSGFASAFSKPPFGRLASTPASRVRFVAEAALGRDPAARSFRKVQAGQEPNGGKLTSLSAGVDGGRDHAPVRRSVLRM
jgi:hypothetical protein